MKREKEQQREWERAGKLVRQREREVGRKKD
jgi:hypothetical protein